VRPIIVWTFLGLLLFRFAVRRTIRLLLRLTVFSIIALAGFVYLKTTYEPEHSSRSQTAQSQACSVGSPASTYNTAVGATLWVCWNGMRFILRSSDPAGLFGPGGHAVVDSLSVSFEVDRWEGHHIDGAETFIVEIGSDRYTVRQEGRGGYELNEAVVAHKGR
jgi:hypothetical protein